ncbi:HAMP domain-containing protein [Granulicella sp. WH15]|uniref:ATP-binding protein n=1 Tax=Granulicella sp. WH15 TaxID=2602070 RepID=UPI001366A50B|nr:ATP-binding protein [Granulicella sp. WH15]QHN02593.1 HAMP domain-containing protein [Granulicella sp. WH15]
MKITLRSLRIRLSLLYIIFTLTSMICLGCFSYWYLSRQLESSRKHTMEAREERVIRYIATWPRQGPALDLLEKLQLFSIALASTDIIQAYELDGSLIYSSPGSPEFKVPWPNKSCLERCYDLVHQNGHTVRTLDHVVILDGHKIRLSLSGKIDEHEDILRAVRNSYLLFCPLLLLASAAGGYVLSNRALTPVSQMTTEARKIGIQDLERRLPVPDTGDELQTLAETWNELLGRLETAVARLTQFTGDISHDLSTTITIMLTTASLALSRTRSTEEYQSALSTIAVECEATSQLLEDLLAVARADLVHQNIERRPVPISQIVLEMSQHFAAKARLKNQVLTSRIDDDAWMLGDLSLLRRMVTILLDNAIKYTPESGSISISLEANGETIQLVVKDTGIGIPAEALPKIFDRFYRVDQARSQEEGSSSGLGLSIAKWVVEAHQSVITVDSKPGEGSTFTVSIPEQNNGVEATHLAAF